MILPRYPIYVISKGRADSRLTAKALERMGAPYRIVIEPQELEAYAEHIAEEKILTLPFSNLGQGSIPARNWVWDHSIEEGHARHWILDDNLSQFYRYHENKRSPVRTPAPFASIEDWADRWLNVPMAGMNYHNFIPPKYSCWKPIRLNARVYSCILLDNRHGDRWRWRGRYNEDTDLSLRILKAGFCTGLFNLWLTHKVATMTMKGGNTDELYRQNEDFDGRLEMAKSLKRQHPDCAKITRKYGRWHHHVDYRRFKANRLLPDPDWIEPERPKDYGLVKRKI